MKKSVANIFEKRPEQWDLRGDPYLWSDLEKIFTNILIPYPKVEFQKEFFKAFEKLTGFKFDSKKDIHIPKYSHGGMSSGYISMDFWVKTALPLLIKRLDVLNNENIK